MMEKRWKEFQVEVNEVEKLEIAFIKLSVWMQQWAAYIAKGGDRPPRPHG